MGNIQFGTILFCTWQSLGNESVLKPTDWVMILTSLFLGGTALFVPYFAELVKRRFFNPVANFTFSLSPPYCHLTSWNQNDAQSKVYYFRFLIKNIGKTLLSNCENVVEKMWHYDSSGKPQIINNFTPVNLKWSGNQEKQFMNINPGKGIFCDIGYLPTLDFQAHNQNSLINISGYNNHELRLVFEFSTIYNSQLNCIPPGTFALQIITYSENYKNITNYLKITWSGKWKEEEENLFKELVIEKIDSIK